MSKATVSRLFVAASVVVVAGLVIGLTALVVALVSGVVALGGRDVVAVNPAALAGMLVWLAIAALVIASGAVAALASWIGALLNTAQLEDKTWFAVLLVLGVFSFGWLAMIAYVVAGPDGSRQPELPRAIAAAPSS